MKRVSLLSLFNEKKVIKNAFVVAVIVSKNGVIETVVNDLDVVIVVIVLR